MSDFNEESGLSFSDNPQEQDEASSNIFLNMSKTDDVTGIPSLKQAPESAISSSTSDSKFNTQMVIALSVLAIGGGAIYAMRYIGMKAGLDENIASIEYASETSSVDFTKRFKNVMSTLDQSTISFQIANTDSFAENPFSLPGAVEDEVIEIDPGMSEEERLEIQRQRDLAREIERRREMVIEEAFNFRLKGIIGGSRPAARISGQAVRSGMQLGEYFSVVEITGQHVVIEADSMRFQLTMGSETVQLD
ncbi:MAG: hypothetical protein JKX70_11775 [Phycisphaerales bacterium]|nr:hypothetical protein [Phycisphaerales bacterium]